MYFKVCFFTICSSATVSYGAVQFLRTFLQSFVHIPYNTKQCFISISTTDLLHIQFLPIECRFTSSRHILQHEICELSAITNLRRREKFGQFTNAKPNNFFNNITSRWKRFELFIRVT